MSPHVERRQKEEKGNDIQKFKINRVTITIIVTSDSCKGKWAAVLGHSFLNSVEVFLTVEILYTMAVERLIEG